MKPEAVAEDPADGADATQNDQDLEEALVSLGISLIGLLFLKLAVLDCQQLLDEVGKVLDHGSRGATISWRVVH